MIEEYIEQHPLFITKNPEYQSIAGFLDKSARLRLQELEKEIPA